VRPGDIFIHFVYIILHYVIPYLGTNYLSICLLCVENSQLVESEWVSSLKGKYMGRHSVWEALHVSSRVIKPPMSYYNDNTRWAEMGFTGALKLAERDPNGSILMVAERSHIQCVIHSSLSYLYLYCSRLKVHFSLFVPQLGHHDFTITATCSAEHRVHFSLLFFSLCSF